MRQLRSIIVDDEPGNIVTLKELLSLYCPGIEVAGSASNPEQAYDLVQAENPDIIFLDIEMPYGNAFDLLDMLAPVRSEVIFITAFNDYAIKAIKYAALDYILKPVSIEELKTAVVKAVKRIEEKSINTRITSLLENMRQAKTLQKIGLQSDDGYRFEDLDNIMRIESAGNFVYVYVKGKGRELIAKTLKEFEDALPPAIFCRVHHSQIININFVKRYFKGRGGYVEMEDGTKVEISVRRKNEFLEKFL